MKLNGSAFLVKATLGLCFVALIFIFVGLFASAPGTTTSSALVNRCLGAGLMWVTIVGLSQCVRDVTPRKDNERELARMSRLYSALSQVNQAIGWMQGRDEMLQKVCRALVDQGGFHMAWIGWHDPDTQRMMPVAEWGVGTDYLRNVEVYADERPEGCGPIGLAFRTGRPFVCNDMLHHPITLPWRVELERHGFKSGAAFPIRLKNEVCGTLAVYADEPDYFREQEVTLLEEAADDLSYALDKFALEEAQQQSERTVRQERDFSEAVLNSLPGVLYMYDQNGKFLRWNKNFERVSGYDSAEVASLKPLDFFAGPQKELLALRMNEVFQKGAVELEAGFVARDGRVTPYYFTGVMTELDSQKYLVGVGIDITRRKEAEESLSKSEARYRLLVEYAPDGIISSRPDGYYLTANPSMCRMLGYTLAEFVGLYAADVIVPDESPYIQPTLAAIETAATHHREWHFRRKDGSVFPADVIATKMPDGNILGMVRDITERKEAEANLRESEGHLIEAQRIAKLGSWQLNISTNRLRWSDQIYEIFGMVKTGGGVSYEAFLERVHSGDRESFKVAQQAALVGDVQLDFEHRIVLLNGREKYVHQLGVLKRDEAGVPIYLEGTTLDITDRKRAEGEREKRYQAEAADRIKSAFLASMSHELRTPLNSILGFTGIILQGLAGPLNFEQNKQLELVRSSARHLLALVNDVLDISKIEAGQLEVARERFDLRLSVLKVVTLIAPLAEKKGLLLRVTLAPDLGEAVTDERRFEQILINLLSNAVKFTERGEIVLSAELVSDFRLSDATAGERAVCVVVTDTGIGIRSDDLATLFQPFRQIDSGLSRTHDGTGLGLAICRRLADLMGGCVTAASEWEKGSTFSITIPLGDGVDDHQG